MRGDTSATTSTRRSGRAIRVLAAIAMLSTSLVVASASPSSAAQPVPWDECPNTAFQTFGEFSELNFSYFDIESAEVDVISAWNPPPQLNAIDYDLGTNLVWAMSNQNGEVWTIDRNGDWFLMGTVPGVLSSIAGTVVGSGRYASRAGSSSDVQIVDIDPDSSGYLTLEGRYPLRTAAGNPVTFDVADMAYNPADGMIYAATQTTRLVRIDPTPRPNGTLLAADLGAITGVTGASSFGGQFFSADGSFYVLQNNAGGGERATYQIDLVSRQAALLATAAPNVSINDGGACLFAGDYGDAPDSYGTAKGGTVEPAFHLTRSNEGDFAGLARLGALIDTETNGVPTPGADGDDARGQDDEDAIAPGTTITVVDGATAIDVPVDNAAASPVTLSAWADFDGNGTFDPDERSMVPVAPGQTSAPLAWSGVDMSGLPPTGFVRLRIAGESVADPQPTGTQTGGEVEDHQVTFTTNQADLRLDKAISNTSPPVGERVTFTLSVGNDGPQDATAVSVVDTVPPGYADVADITGGGVASGSTVTWTGLAVPDGGSVDVSFSAVVQEQGGYVNSAEITASDRPDPDSTPGNGVDTDGDGNVIDDVGDEDDGDAVGATPRRTPDLHVLKSLDGNADEDASGTVTVGDTLTFRIDVQNTGNVTLEVEASDPMLDGLVCVPATPASLAPGASTSCTGTYEVTQDDVDTGTIENHASATGTDSSGTAVTDDDTHTVSIPAVGGISLDKTVAANADEDSSGSVTADDTLTYSLTATNVGETTLSGVTIDDPSIATLDCAPALPATLVPGASVTCTGEAVVSQAQLDAGLVENTATTSGTDPRGTEVTDRDQAQIVPQSISSIDLDKVLDSNADEDSTGTVTLGDTVTYGFTATNTGTVTLTDVSIADAMPGLGALTCTPGQPTTLAPGESLECTASITVRQHHVDAGRLDNTATATATPPSGPPVADDDSETVTVAQDPSIRVAKTVLGAGDTPGETNDYRFLITNDGTVTLTDVALSDPMVPTLDCDTPLPAAALAPGGTITCTGSYTLAQGDIDAGRVDNTVEVTATTPSDTTTTDTDRASTPAEQNSSARLIKTATTAVDVDGSGDLTAGDVQSYSFEVVNDGNVTFTARHVDDPSIGQLDCGDATVAPGTSVFCEAGTYEIQPGDVDAGTFLNTATADIVAANGDTLSPSDTAVITPAQHPGIQVDKRIVGLDAAVGLDDEVTYAFVVTNTGNVTLTDIVVDDPPVAVSCPGTELAADESMTCTGSRTADQADLDAGGIDNHVEVRGTPPSGPDVSDTDDERLTLEQTPDITVVKTVDGIDDVDGSGDLTPGDVVTYETDATNTGNVTLGGVTMEDPDAVLVDCDLDTPATLAPNESLTCTFTMAVTQDQIDDGSILNTATSSGQLGDGPVVTDEGSAVVDIPPAPDVEVAKAVLDAPPLLIVGDVLDYTFTVTNVGNVTLTGITLTDSLPGVTPECPAVALAPGESLTCTASYVLTQADTLDAALVNEVTASATPPSGPAVTDTDTVTLPMPPIDPDVPATDGQLSIDKVVVGDPGVAEPGTVVTFEIVVSNAGPGLLSHVNVTDPLPGLSPLDCDRTLPATLDAGDDITCRAGYTVTQADAEAGSVRNVAAAHGTDPDGRQLVVSDAAVVTTGVVVTPTPTPTPATPSSSGGPLAFTGGAPWPLAAIGFVLVLTGLAATSSHRRLRTV